MKKKLTITIDCSDDDYCESVVNMITFMADPKGIRQWKADIQIYDVQELSDQVTIAGYSACDGEIALSEACDDKAP